MRQTFRIEAHVKEAVKECLKEHNWFNWPNVASPHSVQGLSDRAALYHGLFFAIECKFGDNPLRPAQHRFLREVQENGGISLVVNEANIDSFRNYVDRVSAERGGRVPSVHDKLLRALACPRDLVYVSEGGAALRGVR